MNQQKAMPDGRVWRRIGTEPYIRKDGSETVLVVWETGCAVCGTLIQIRTPVDFSTTKAFLRKHCDAHKKAWRPFNVQKPAC
ncbi:hypothetical protein JK151_08935 [Ralstonia syzygii subsp. celebesensis]|uniref:Uncharacterized protein n=1 Tax=blood disease bacterium R229 TaxID=741978 RepID=G2ZK41_9RALS|nr:hypothetical protein [Ralstonia syzygii]QQV54344.1 hypothetical protein JK151_08935 [Ralstonia syzygii subsp. celebesensis]CCA79404.1 hypothetical protein BDB_60011 [blood disease bacterium R229]